MMGVGKVAMLLGRLCLANVVLMAVQIQNQPTAKS
jgi:hypothetical protein